MNTKRQAYAAQEPHFACSPSMRYCQLALCTMPADSIASRDCMQSGALAQHMLLPDVTLCSLVQRGSSHAIIHNYLKRRC